MDYNLGNSIKLTNTVSFIILIQQIIEGYASKLKQRPVLYTTNRNWWEQPNAKIKATILRR